MIDAATLEFPYTPPGGYTREYLDSREYILELMAEKLDRLSTGRGPVGFFICGEPGDGKTTMLDQLRDIASLRHGGTPTLALVAKEGKSTLKLMADGLLDLVSQPEHAKPEYKGLKAAIKDVSRWARLDPSLYDRAVPTMKSHLLTLCDAWKKAGLRVVVFIDDVDETESIEMSYLVNFISTTQSRQVPMLFVLSGPKSTIRPIVSVRSDASRLFSIYHVNH